jgi:hypothetical protein
VDAVVEAVEAVSSETTAWFLSPDVGVMTSSESLLAVFNNHLFFEIIFVTL